MRRVFSVFLCLALVLFSAQAEIRLTDSSVMEDSKIAAAEYGALDAFFNPSDNNIYYLARTDDGYNVVLFGSSGDFETVYQFDNTDAFLSIRADEAGTIYLLRQSSDPSKKSSIVRLTNENGKYVMNEYFLPIAASDLIPRRLEFSSASSGGCLLMWMNNMGQYVSVVSMFNVVWGALEGYDSVITITPGILTAEVVSMESLADAYGYINEEGLAFAKRISVGDVLTPSDVSLSPSGDLLLAAVPFQDSTLLYVIDIYTLSLELVYPPDGFSGTVGWIEDDRLMATNEKGEQTELIYGGISEYAWSNAWEDSWSEGESARNALGDWGSAELDDWNP